MRWKLFSLGVGLASFATIAFELLLTRIFSVTMYYHFAFMVISIAMLGLSIAGVSIYLAPRLFKDENAPLLASFFMLAFALLSLWALKTTLENPVSLTNWRENFSRLALLYVSAGLTMLCTGFAISIAIAAAKERIGQVYAFDLIGAALGCLFLIPSISAFGGPGAILAVAALAAVAAVVFAFSFSRPGKRAIPGLLAAAGMITAVVLVFFAATENSAKRFGAARNSGKFLGNRMVEFERWNAFSQITVAPGQPDYKWIFIDADAATRIWSGDVLRGGASALDRFGEIRVASLVYALRHERPALIIGPGGGTDVLSALRNGVPKVTGVEVNPIIVNNVMKRKYAPWSGDLYRDPRVNVVVDEGRSHIRRSEDLFGSIQATLVDTWAASSSGAFTLSENNIYTVEAFSEFLEHLAPGGIVCVTRWYDPAHPTEFLRLVAVGREALARRGVQPSDIYKHFVLATDGERRGTLLLNKDPFTQEEIQKLADKAVEGRLSLLFAPFAPTGPLAGSTPRNTAGEDAFMASFLRSNDAAGFLDKLPYDASPSTDDKPFFFYTLRPRTLLSILSRLTSLETHNLGVGILLALLVFAAVLTVVFVLLPLLIFERKTLRTDGPTKMRILGYFLCLGLGFILVEIGFMQTFVLFLGHPIYALAVVLASLLAASGVGSAASGKGIAKWGPAGFVKRGVGALAIVLLFYAFGLTHVFHGLLGIPLMARILVAVVLVVIPGLLMGSLLPTGVRMASKFGSGTVSWAWGLNGAASVVGSIAAIIISMNVGFTIALVVGILIYGCAALLMPSRVAV